MLQLYRREVLPFIYSQYDDFSGEEKQSLSCLCIFFCGLHALANFAKTTQTAKIGGHGSFDGNGPIFDNQCGKDKEPGICLLFRRASKSFAAGTGGNKKSGCQDPFRKFKHKMVTVPIKSYRVKRFSILFENASKLYFLHSQMETYLETSKAKKGC